MNNLIFSGENDVFIKWAKIVSTPYEDSKETHLTQFSSIELEKYKEIGLDFHYELHMSSSKPFIRFDCHIYKYSNHKNYKTEENMLESLSNENKLHIYYIRQRLKEIFKKEFYNRCSESFIADKYNYLGLIKRNINTLNYNEAIIESEKFIKDTYDKVIKLIKDVIN